MSLLQTETDIFPVTSNWVDTPIFYPNTTKQPDTQAAYIQFNIVQSMGEQPATGTSDRRPERTRGDLIGSLFMPVGKTTYNGKRGSELGEDFKKLLSPKRIGKTLTSVGRVVDAGLDEDGSRYRYNIIIPYITDTEISI